MLSDGRASDRTVRSRRKHWTGRHWRHDRRMPRRIASPTPFARPEFRRHGWSSRHELADEALGRDGGPRHADAVALGEADETWPQIVNDAVSGQLKETYALSTTPEKNANRR